MPASPAPGVLPLLVLWDVDHTLIETRGVGRAIYERAFLAATGERLIELASVSGRTELDIMSETLRINGIEPTRDMITALANELTQGYEDARDELHAAGRALPGARDALAGLAVNPAVHQSVLTGNLRAVARIKLEVFGLDAYVDLGSGAYGDDDLDRAELVCVAMRRANDRVRSAFAADSTVLIGDTSKDVEAGLTASVRVIGVATGKTPAPVLREAGAHFVAQDLSECYAILTSLARQRREASSPVD